MKYTLQWLLVYSSCAAITIVSFRTFSSPKPNPISISNHSLVPLPSWQPLLLVSMDLPILNAHVNGIIHFVAFVIGFFH